MRLPHARRSPRQTMPSATWIDAARSPQGEMSLNPESVTTTPYEAEGAAWESPRAVDDRSRDRCQIQSRKSAQARRSSGHRASTTPALLGELGADGVDLALDRVEVVAAADLPALARVVALDAAAGAV